MTDTVDDKEVVNVEWISKVRLIEECLQGCIDDDDAYDDDDNNNMIDLWQLREYCLTKGGLLDPKLRKRAWPILTQALLLTNNNTTVQPNQNVSSTTVSLSTKDILQIQRDIKRTVWNVKAHFRSQQRQLASNATASTNANDDATVSTGTRRVMFAIDEDNTNSKETKIGDAHKKDGDENGSSSHSNEDDHIQNANPNDGAIQLMRDDEDASQTTMSSFGSGATSSMNSRSIRRNSYYRKVSKHEQRTLFNVITNCLNTISIPTSTTENYDCRYHYFNGLNDLTALIMVNVESLSISSILLRKLASYHLRDAFRNDRIVLDTALKVIFFPLLKSIDIELYDHVAKQGVVRIKKLTALVASCTSNWFASDVADITAASRLIDVFLVSHPTTPLYCSIAILVYYKKTIISSSNFDWAVRHLPLFQCDPESETAAKAISIDVEKIISMTLMYMDQHKPSKLVELCSSVSIWSDEVEKHLFASVSNVSMLSATPPTWCTDDVSPNEWMIIQNTINPKSSMPSLKSSTGKQLGKYPLSLIALGRELPLPKDNVKKDNVGHIRMNYILLSLIVIFATAIVHYSGTIALKVDVPVIGTTVDVGSNIMSGPITSRTEAEFHEPTIDSIVYGCTMDCQTESSSNTTDTLSKSVYEEKVTEMELLQADLEGDVSSVPSPDSVAVPIILSEEAQNIDKNEDTLEPLFEVDGSVPETVTSVDTEDMIAMTDSHNVDSTEISHELFDVDSINNHVPSAPLKLDIDVQPISSPTLSSESLMDMVNVISFSDVELAFDHWILRLVGHRMTKIDHRLQSLQPHVAEVTKILAPFRKEITSKFHVYSTKITDVTSSATALTYRKQLLSVLSIFKGLKLIRTIQDTFFVTWIVLVRQALGENVVFQKWKATILPYIVSTTNLLKDDMARVESKLQPRFVEFEIQADQFMNQTFESLKDINTKTILSLQEMKNQLHFSVNDYWSNTVVSSWNQLSRCAINCKQ